ncbi:MAG: response regulator [Candidatus Omnitrophica bacterium]|nr:response regulator [Candidatus Omnitrophota bacterium]MCM8770748.1 response regulator [Candidatus Omnitrophota bacterium]
MKPYILIADDEDDARLHLSSFLSRRFDCGLEQAKDGKETIEKLKNRPFDLVLLDMKMPHVSGLEVLGYIKDASPSTKTLIISGYDDFKEECLKKGADDFIAKPYDLEVLETKINSLLNAKKEACRKT